MKRKILLIVLLWTIVAGVNAQPWLDAYKEGVYAYKRADYNTAIIHLTKAIPLVKKEAGETSEDYAVVIGTLGKTYNQLRDYTKAEQLLIQTTDIYKKHLGIGSKLYIDYCFTLALMYVEISRFDQAEKYYFDGIDGSRKLYPGELDLAYVLNSVAMFLMGQYKYESSEKLFTEALNIVENKLGADNEEVATLKFNLGSLYSEMLEYDKAELLLMDAMKIRKRLYGVTSNDYSSILNNLAVLYVQSGQYDKAEPLSLESVEISKAAVGENHPDYAIGINNLAYLYKVLGQYERAEELCIQAAGIFKTTKGPDHPDYASCLNNLGSVYQHMGKYDLAEEYYLESIQIDVTNNGKNSPGYANKLSNLAYLYRDLGQFPKAELLLGEALEIRKNILGTSHSDYADALNALAVLCVDQHKYTRAEQWYTESLNILKKSEGTNSISYAIGLNNLASLYYEMDQFKKAEPLYKESITITKTVLGENHPDYASKLNNLAYLYRNQGEYSKAEPLLLEALEIIRQNYGTQHPDYAFDLGALAAVYELKGDYEKAFPLYEESRMIILSNIEENFQFLSESEKEKYVALTTNSFQTFQNFYFQAFSKISRSSASAFDIQLATRGIILNSGVELKHLANQNDQDSLKTLYDQWKQYKTLVAKELSKPLADRKSYLKRWEEKSEEIEKKLNRTLANFKDLQQINYSWKNIKASLNDQETAVEFVSFNHHNKTSFTDSVFYCALVVSSNDTAPHYVPMFEEKQLGGLLRGDSLKSFANLLYTGAQVRTIEDHDISYGDSLYKLIWEPLMPYLKNTTHLYYAPTGLLHKINLDAIPCNTSELLSDKYRLDRLTSTTNITISSDKKIDISSIELFGGIQYDVDTVFFKSLAAKNKSIKRNENYSFGTRSLIDSLSRGGTWSYLAGTKKEVQDISDLLKNAGVKYSVHAVDDATEEKMKSLEGNDSPTVLHFSTHGYFFPDPVLSQKNLEKNFSSETAFQYSDNPLFRSGLIMAGANYVWKGNKPVDGAEDGILTAYEVSNLYLPNTKLVVMSACETGLGDIKGSEGVYGLQRAFKMAGVDYIIMTLWQVLDKETSEFMILFYQNLLTKKSIPDAFKMTQDTMKNKYRDEPYKWAGFVLIH